MILSLRQNLFVSFARASIRRKSHLLFDEVDEHAGDFLGAEVQDCLREGGLGVCILCVWVCGMWGCGWEEGVQRWMGRLGRVLLNPWIIHAKRSIRPVRRAQVHTHTAPFPVVLPMVVTTRMRTEVAERITIWARNPIFTVCVLVSIDG